jgi:hypothetical protein
MPTRDGDRIAREADETLAYFGRENLEVLGDVYQVFVADVDTKALLAWTIRDPLDDLLLPLFRAALVAITKDLRLGELAGQTTVTGGKTEWSWRVRSTSGPGQFDGPIVTEEEARRKVREANAGAEGPWISVVLKRTVAEWTEVHDA